MTLESSVFFFFFYFVHYLSSSLLKNTPTQNLINYSSIIKMINNLQNDDEVQDDEDDYVIKKEEPSQKDNYPAWMRDMVSKQTDFNQRFERVQQQQKTLLAGLDEFDQKQADHARDMRIHKIKKREEQESLAAQREQQRLEKISNHLYFENKAYQRNLSKPLVRLSNYVFSIIISFFDDPVVIVMRLRRVCRRLNVQLLDDEFWEDICRDQFGNAFVLLNQPMVFDGYWKQTAQLFRMQWATVEEFYAQYLIANCPQDIQVVSIIIRCIETLTVKICQQQQFFQQLFSISGSQDFVNKPEPEQVDDCKQGLVQRFFNYTAKLDFSLKALTYCTHYGVKDDARQVLITLTRHHNFAGCKIFFDEETSLATKQIINQEIVSCIPKELMFYVPTIYRYSWVSQKDSRVCGWLRDPAADQLMIESFLKQPQIDCIIYFYNRYAHENPLKEYYSQITIRKNTIEGRGYSGSSHLTFQGQFKLTYLNSLPKKPDPHVQGTKYWGIGDLQMSLNGSANFCCLTYYCMGAQTKNGTVMNHFPLIIANHENKLIVLIKQL